MIGIIDYGVGNLGSILNMCKRVGVRAMLCSTPTDLHAADRYILPGVGAFDDGMQRLRACNQLPVLERAVKEEGRPVLGICLGMQLLSEGSEEGEVPGLGWLGAKTLRIPSEGQKTPHMGWNIVELEQAEHPLFTDIPSPPRFYFLHGYYLACSDPADVIGMTDYGVRFVSVAARGNIMGVQFHPEKSHRFGMQLIKNFATL